MTAREPRPRRRQGLAGLAAVVVLLAAACGTSESPSPRPSAGSEATPGATASSGPSLAPSFALPSFGPAALRWFCCLGNGSDPDQRSVEGAVAAGVAQAFPGSSLKLEVDDSGYAIGTLQAMIRGGSAPDIVGPIGLDSLATLQGQWLDLAPLLAASHYDQSQFNPGAVGLYQGPNGQFGMPFDVSPSMLWYQKEMFGAAGLVEPPHRYGERYTMPDGSVVDWSTDTLAHVARLLTLDVNGRNATDPAFDRTHIVQYGFEPQRDDLRSLGAFWGAGSLVGADGRTVALPEAWKAGWRFFYDGMWGPQPFIMTGQVFNSEAFNGGGYAFFSGKVAMSENFLWSTFGVAAAGPRWDLAAIPSYNGTVTAPATADTFGILKSTKSPSAAFAVLTYLLGDGSDRLLGAYAAMPARPSKQDAFLAQLSRTDGFPAQVDWQVAKDSLAHVDSPSFAAATPRYDQTVNILQKYLGRWTTTPGLDLDAEFQHLASEIQAQWNT